MSYGDWRSIHLFLVKFMYITLYTKYTEAKQTDQTLIKCFFHLTRNMKTLARSVA